MDKYGATSVTPPPCNYFHLFVNRQNHNENKKTLLKIGLNEVNYYDMTFILKIKSAQRKQRKAPYYDKQLTIINWK